MKIVFFRHSLLSRGGDKMIVAHANHLVSAGHDVCINTAVLDTVFAIDPRISLNKLPSSNKLATVISALTARLPDDLVIADIIPMTCLLLFRNRHRLVYFAQDYDESYYSSPLQKALIRCFYFIGLKIFRIPTIAVSHPLADLLKRRFSARVTVAENGVDSRVFYPDPDQELVVAKANRKAFLLLSRSDQRKGFDLAQAVVKRLSVTHSGLFEIWTVGEPGEGLFPDLVHRDFGYVGEEKLRRILSSADIFFYPTRHEGLPLMPLESIACGCPVVTTTAVPYGNKELSIKVTEIGDIEAMTRILGDFLANDPLLDEFKLNCNDVAGKYDISECKRRFEQVLSAGIGEH